MSTVIQPEDLRAALAAEPEAHAFFDGLTAGQNRGYTEWTEQAKKAPACDGARPGRQRVHVPMNPNRKAAAVRKIINSTYITLDGVIHNPQDWPSMGGFGIVTLTLAARTEKDAR